VWLRILRYVWRWWQVCSHSNACRRQWLLGLSKTEGNYYSRYWPLCDWLRAGRPRGRSSSPGRVKNFLLCTLFRSALGPTQPSTQWVSAALSPWVKRQGRETDHSLPTSAEVKKMWIYTSTPSGGVDICATGYRVDGRGVGVRVPPREIFFSSPRRPDRFCHVRCKWNLSNSSNEETYLRIHRFIYFSLFNGRSQWQCALRH
jgi:hypothetical protein